MAPSSTARVVAETAEKARCVARRDMPSACAYPRFARERDHRSRARVGERVGRLVVDRSGGAEGRDEVVRVQDEVVEKVGLVDRLDELRVLRRDVLLDERSRLEQLAACPAAELALSLLLDVGVRNAVQLPVARVGEVALRESRKRRGQTLTLEHSCRGSRPGRASRVRGSFASCGRAPEPRAWWRLAGESV